MNASQVTNKMLENHFNVSIVGGFYAEDSIGRRHYLTDLRTRYIRENNKKTKRVPQNAKNIKKEYVDDFFVALDRAFPEHDVIIRKTQPGMDLSDLGLKLYCIVSTSEKHTLTMYSKVFSRKELETEFGYFKRLKKDQKEKNNIALCGLSFDEVVEVINKSIQMHKIAQN